MDDRSIHHIDRDITRIIKEKEYESWTDSDDYDDYQDEVKDLDNHHRQDYEPLRDDNEPYHFDEYELQDPNEIDKHYISKHGHWGYSNSHCDHESRENFDNDDQD